MVDLPKFLKKTGLIIGLLLLLVAGMAFVVSLLLAAESGTREETFTKTQLMPVIAVSAVVFVLALVLTVVSGVLAWKEFATGLKEEGKWKKRL